MNGQFDHVVVVIHASRNPYDITFVCSVFLDDEIRQRDLLFDILPAVNHVTHYGMTKDVPR